MDTREYVDELHAHWWWRPGWREGRHFYACHITLEDQIELQRLVTAYQAALAGIDGLDLIPRKWLHLTLQGIGFLDEVNEAEIEAVVRAIVDATSNIPPPTVAFRDAVIRPEAIYLPAAPAWPLRKLREAVFGAVVKVLGRQRVPDSAENLNEYRPHVSVAYANRDQPAASIMTALGTVRAASIQVTFDRLSLLEFHRDRRMYEWTANQPLPLQGATV